MDVNVNSFCRFLAKKYVGFWQRFYGGAKAPHFIPYFLENISDKLLTNAFISIVLSFSIVCKCKRSTKRRIETSSQIRYNTDKA